MNQHLFNFPSYTAAERAADRVIHYIGVPLCIAGAILLVYRAAQLGSVTLTATIAVYAFGLVGMVTSSAAYQLAAPGLRKEWLRRLDRGMIFVMIAGTYTPFSVNVLRAEGGAWLCAILWGLAGLGIFVTLRYPRRFERLVLALYLIMGWMILALMRDCFALLSPTVAALIIAGGIAYTVGAIIQSIPKLKFHNPIWHALILFAASVHYAAIGLKLTGAVI